MTSARECILGDRYVKALKELNLAAWSLRVRWIAKVAKSTVLQYGVKILCIGKYSPESCSKLYISSCQKI